MLRLLAKSLAALLAVSCGALSPAASGVSLRAESLATARLLADTLLGLQNTDSSGPDAGAIRCPSCGVLHTRAAEAVYPLAVVGRQPGGERYLRAAVTLGNWLIRQQQADGSWKETPEEWTGTTTDQALMMVLALPLLKGTLSQAEAAGWGLSIRRAADYLVEVMSPEFASINYCTTTTATLAAVNRVFPDPRYVRKARLLARQILAKMDESGFIQGEGERVFDVKYGADIGYEIDMSLWGLELYARWLDDAEMHRAVSASLRNHLYFVYPNGAIDGSWGIRSNKWTTYGSATADGCQVLFSLFAREDPRYREAGLRNLGYLRTMINGGMIGYGPDYPSIIDRPPCVYPTFARAKNLALAAELGDEPTSSERVKIPADEANWARLFPSVDVAVVRTRGMVGTVTGYGYRDLRKNAQSKYTHRPTGGALSCLWVDGHGFLQVSSQTEYNRWEPMHFPAVEGARCLTPRIEFSDRDGYFTNLYNFDGHLELAEIAGGYRVSSAGELSNRQLLPGGVAYSLTHEFTDSTLTKSVRLRYHGKKPTVDLVEPIVLLDGMSFQRVDDRNVLIRGAKREFRVEIVEGNAAIDDGGPTTAWWNVFPSVRVRPILMRVHSPEQARAETVTWRIRLVN